VSDEPTLGEVARTLARIELDLGKRLDDITRRLDRVITLELYEAHQATAWQRFEDLEGDVKHLQEQRAKDEERRAADKRMVNGALIGAALSLLVTIVAAALVVAFQLKGGG
jgi:tetrahydromethanopterin S-methyltransferase subunit G